VRFALRVLLERQPGLEIAAEAADGEALLALAEQIRPDLVLLDWRLAGPAPEQLLATLRQASPGLCVIALSGRPEERGTAIGAGVDDFACKCDAVPRLLRAIEACRASVGSANDTSGNEQS
jgi:two-component system response regulator DesR